MSGHSKWATIKRAKAVTDAKRSAVFTKIANMLTVAAREKGGDVETNFSLRVAIDKAKSANMPKDNIERAIKRGTGELGGDQINEYVYEGIGPGQSQYIIKCLTDNKNRTAAEIRHLFTKAGGSLGSVGWNFEQKGVVRIANAELRMPNEEFELELIEAGADDIKKEEEGVTVFTKIEDLQKVKLFFEEKEIKTESADLEYVAKDENNIEGADVEKIERLEEALEENEDVSDFYSNVVI